MVKFILVKRRNSAEVRVNAAHIVSYGEALNGGSWIDTTTENGDNALLVDETPDVIDSKLGLLE